MLSQRQESHVAQNEAFIFMMGIKVLNRSIVIAVCAAADKVGAIGRDDRGVISAVLQAAVADHEHFQEQHTQYRRQHRLCAAEEVHHGRLGVGHFGDF